MNKYESLSLAKIQHMINRKTNLIHDLQMKEATEDKDLSEKIQAEEAELDLLLEASEEKEQKPALPNGTANQSYERSLKIMELNDALKSVRKFGPGVPAEDFIETLTQKYKIFVKSKLNEYSFLEAEYVNRCLDAMHPTYVNQALNSGEEMKSFEDFNAKTWMTRLACPPDIWIEVCGSNRLRVGLEAVEEFCQQRIRPLFCRLVPLARQLVDRLLLLLFQCSTRTTAW